MAVERKVQTAQGKAPGASRGRSWSHRVVWIGPQRRSCAPLERRVKRGNPHLLQPQAWSMTLLAEARVEGTGPSKRPADRWSNRSEIDGRHNRIWLTFLRAPPKPDSELRIGLWGCPAKAQEVPTWCLKRISNVEHRATRGSATLRSCCRALHWGSMAGGQSGRPGTGHRTR